MAAAAAVQHLPKIDTNLGYIVAGSKTVGGETGAIAQGGSPVDPTAWIETTGGLPGAAPLDAPADAQPDASDLVATAIGPRTTSANPTLAPLACRLAPDSVGTDHPEQTMSGEFQGKLYYAIERLDDGV